MKKFLLLALTGLLCLTGLQVQGQTRTPKPFYGYMVYSSVDWDLGIYSIMPGRGYRMFMVDPYEQIGFDMIPNNGWYKDGKLNGVSMFYMNPSTPMGYFTYSLDLETGKLLKYEEYLNWLKFETIFEICTLDTDNDQIYGYSVDTSTLPWKYYWSWAPESNPLDIHLIREAEEGENFISICYRPDEQLFYGITSEFEFVSIDIEGNITYINILPYYENAAFTRLQSGLIWDSGDEVFYWNAQVYDYFYESIFGFLYSITKTGEIEVVEQYSMDQQFSFFYTTETYINPKAPLGSTIDSIDFEGAALQATMNVTLPTTFGDGNPLPENITFTALLNGETYKSGEAAPGQKLTIDYTFDKPGEYKFGIYVNADGIKGVTTSEVRYIGNDVPMAPENVILTPTEISWDAVTTGVHKGYLDTKNLKYVVSLNGEVLANTSATSYAVDLLKNGSLAKYTATVVAECTGLESEEAESNTIVAGESVSLPLFYEPTEEQFENMTVCNVAGDTYVYGGIYGEDEITWVLTKDGLFSGGTEWASSPMDDYIFLPPVYMTKSNSYTLTFDCGVFSDWFTENSLNVVYGDSPTPQQVKETLLSNYSPNVYLNASDNKWSVWDEVTLDFTVAEDGVYYLGFYCNSAPQMYGIFLKDIKLTSLNDDTGVESVQGSHAIITTKPGMININGGFNEQVQIVGIDGTIAYKGRLDSDNFSYNVAKGIYLVKIADKTTKVIVR